jgi:copper chaperone CopZ
VFRYNRFGMRISRVARQNTRFCTYAANDSAAKLRRRTKRARFSYNFGVETTIELSGLHCQACVGRVKAALAPFAKNVNVTLAPKQTATLTEPNGEFAQWAAAVAGAGAYTASMGARSPVPASIANVSARIPVKPKNAAIGPTPQIAAPAPVPTVAEKSWKTYYPLILLTAFLVLVPALVQVGAASFDWHAWMRHFMAAFFLAFSFFKLLDLRAFADAYAGYDLLAARWRGWGTVYPFVELALGIAYLINFNPPLTNAITLIVMAFSLLGVLRAVASKKTIRCACLGAVFNLPMSTVTIVEDGLMVVMAGWMLCS